MDTLLTLITPWEFSPTVLVTCLLAAGLFLRGLRRCRREGKSISPWRTLSFFTGLILIYGVLQSYFDYVSQHMFWVHRLQHLILHHLGPFLVMLAVPHEVIGRGIPDRLRESVLLPIWYSRPVHGTYRFLQRPWVAAFLFVGLIYLWLTPAIHLYVMLSAWLYKLMNWSMAVDGLLFWWLVVDPRSPQEHGTPSYTTRIVMLWLVMLPQIILGAFISLSGHDLYNVYSICGRVWPISPMTDQDIGGLITWIPAAMMSVLGILVVLRLWTRADRVAVRALRERNRRGASFRSGTWRTARVPASLGGHTGA
ncbi:MAG: hypothetical protein B7Z66_00135 [Chromatiales bacterium 21-64-14]|nr:MAG: hypothetical protein B7Z66_00135 [Chromatiales bacterium 21-64-14]HQU16267.1 cytochrome c oxidase assembly protein [Gammaproteobacteria bacterium]